MSGWSHTYDVHAYIYLHVFFYEEVWYGGKFFKYATYMRMCAFSLRNALVNTHAVLLCGWVGRYAYASVYVTLVIVLFTYSVLVFHYVK